MGAYHESQRGGGEERRTRDARAFVENVEEMVERLPAGEAVPTISIDGEDLSGTVVCVVDVDGALTRIVIDDGWWDAVGPGGVAAAVLDALRSAKSKSTMARLIFGRHGLRDGRAPVDLGRLFTGELSEPLPPYDDDRFSAALARTADRALTILDAARRFGQLRDSPLRWVVSGPRGMFRVHMKGLNVVGAEVGEVSLHRSDAAVLAEDALAALSRATSPEYQTEQATGRGR
jgi:hypothetical protein